MVIETTPKKKERVYQDLKSPKSSGNNKSTKMNPKNATQASPTNKVKNGNVDATVKNKENDPKSVRKEQIFVKNREKGGAFRVHALPETKALTMIEAFIHTGDVCKTIKVPKEEAYRFTVQAKSEKTKAFLQKLETNNKVTTTFNNTEVEISMAIIKHKYVMYGLDHDNDRSTLQTDISEKNGIKCEISQFGKPESALWLITTRQPIDTKYIKTLAGAKRIKPLKVTQQSDRRCFNCQDYGHIASKCPGETVCSKCGDPHEWQSCQSDNKWCVTCKSTEHRSSDVTCPKRNKTEQTLAQVIKKGENVQSQKQNNEISDQTRTDQPIQPQLETGGNDTETDKTEIEAAIKKAVAIEVKNLEEQLCAKISAIIRNEFISCKESSKLASEEKERSIDTKFHVLFDRIQELFRKPTEEKATATEEISEQQCTNGSSSVKAPPSASHKIDPSPAQVSSTPPVIGERKLKKSGPDKTTPTHQEQSPMHTRGGTKLINPQPMPPKPTNSSRRPNKKSQTQDGRKL